jgi:hypothetical protein
MPNILTHRASELRPETRAAVEAELGRSLDDEEEVSIMAFAPHEAPEGDARQDAARRLTAHLARVDERLEQASKKEIEENLQEALRSVRPRCRERE